jgi:hypothetical protein
MLDSAVRFGRLLRPIDVVCPRAPLSSEPSQSIGLRPLLELRCLARHALRLLFELDGPPPAVLFGRDAESLCLDEGLLTQGLRKDWRHLAPRQLRSLLGATEGPDPRLSAGLGTDGWLARPPSVKNLQRASHEVDEASRGYEFDHRVWVDVKHPI